jgi:hypothetical protein
VHRSLWLALAARPPRVQPQLEALRPRVAGLRLTAARASVVALEPVVEDGERRYAILDAAARPD